MAQESLMPRLMILFGLSNGSRLAALSPLGHHCQERPNADPLIAGILPAIRMDRSTCVGGALFGRSPYQGTQRWKVSTRVLQPLLWRTREGSNL